MIIDKINYSLQVTKRIASLEKTLADIVGQANKV